jgi:hypothetical protein
MLRFYEQMGVKFQWLTLPLSLKPKIAPYLIKLLQGILKGNKIAYPVS